MFELDNLTPPVIDNTHANRIKILQREGLLTKEISGIIYVIRIKRHEAIHEELHYQAKISQTILMRMEVALCGLEEKSIVTTIT